MKKNNVAETSLMAYIDLLESGNLNRNQIEVLKVFRKNPDRSFTNMEVADMLGWSINRVTPRTKELRDAGYLLTVGQRACLITGNTAYAMELIL